MKDSKVIKEYDVKGSNPMFDVITTRERTLSYKISLWFSIILGIITNWYYNKKSYFKNLIRFNKMMKEWHPWDYDSQIKLFAYGIEQLANYIEKNGNEVHESRDKKVSAMRELVTLLRKDYEEGLYEKYLKGGKNNDAITHVTEYENGCIGFETIDEESQKIKSESIKKYDNAVKKARDKHYKRIFEIIRGQVDLREKALKIVGEKKEDETLEEYNKRLGKVYDEMFDGTGIECWWD